MGAPLVEYRPTEQRFVDQCLTTHMVEKIINFIKKEEGKFENKNIPQLFAWAYVDLVVEETNNFITENDFPTINFKTLKYFVNNKVKELKPEIFKRKEKPTL